MTHSMTLYIADKNKNKFMQLFDLKPDHKWYIDRREVSFKTSSLKIHLSPNDYFMGIINKFKENEKFWIPAILYRQRFYAAEGVKALSDGENILFI